MSNLKLRVDVVGARNLLLKDGQGSSGAFVELKLGEQKQYTTTKETDNPIWNESFSFNIIDPSKLHKLVLNAYVYSSVKATSSKSNAKLFLGKVSLPSKSFVNSSDAVVLQYRLEKRRSFSVASVSGDLGLKVYLTDDDIDSSTAIARTRQDSNPLALMEVGASGDQGDSTASTSSSPVAADEFDSSTAIAAVESLAWTRRDSNPLALMEGKGRDKGDSTARTSLTPVAADESLAIANMDTSPALEWIQGDSNPLALVNGSTSNKELVTRLRTFHHRSNSSNDHRDETASNSSSQRAAVDAFAIEIANPVRTLALWPQGDSNTVDVINSSPSPNDEAVTGLTSPDHEDDVNTSIKSSTPLQSLAIEHPGTYLALQWTQGDLNPPAEITSTTSANAQAEVGAGHTSSDHGENANTPIAEVQSREITNASILALAWTEGDSNPPAAIYNDSNTSPNVEADSEAQAAEAKVGTRHTFIHSPNPSHDQGDKIPSTSVPVGPVYFLYVRVVKARNLADINNAGNISLCVQATIDSYIGTTKQHLGDEKNPVWNQVISYSVDRIKSSDLVVVIKDKDKDLVVGRVSFKLDVSTPRWLDAAPLAPEWYRLADQFGGNRQAQLMLAIWYGNEADAAFSDAWNSDAASVVDYTPLGVLGPNAYLAPRLWYLRVIILGTENLFAEENNRFRDAYAKVWLKDQVLETKAINAQNQSLLWNEDLWFVSAKPFEDTCVVVKVMGRARPGEGEDEVIGMELIPLHSVYSHLNDCDDCIIPSQWYTFPPNFQSKSEKFERRIHLRIWFEGGYHVLNESPLYNSDLRPSAHQLWRTPIGTVNLEIQDAQGIHPMTTRDGRGTADTYCVAKYGNIWVRTKTVGDNLCPNYDESFTWNVYDPATVLTVGVFNNSQLGDDSSNGNEDLKIGKIRICISTLEAGRLYTRSYPLLAVHPTGVEKMGELNLTIRFRCTSFKKMLYMYSQPLMPKMHSSHPISDSQLNILVPEAINLVAERFRQYEPPLRKGVVDYMSDGDSHLWSMRRSSANIFRVSMVLSGLFSVAGWFFDICSWKNPILTVLAHAFFLALVCSPRLILPTAFLYMFLTGLWNFRIRHRDPLLINTKLMEAELDPDELEEEFDTFPTSQSLEVVTKRYDRLRRNASRVQTIVSDVAAVGERIQILLSWRDSRATALFITFCLVSAFVLYVTPLQVTVGLAGFYMMMHPRFRNRIPSAIVPLVNFFHRLPTRTGIML